MKKFVFGVVGLVLTGVILAAGLGLFWRFGSTNYLLTGVPVLNYHQVNDRFQTVLTMKPTDFEEQMKYLHDHGYHSITQEQFAAYMRGEGSLPDRPVMITFDDGYVDNYEQAYPILKKYGFTGTIFLIVDLVGKPGYLTWDQVQEMGRNGMEFGSHTMSHKPLTGFDRQGVRTELRESKAAIESHLQKPCEYIAFPEGEFDGMVMKETRAAEYEYGFTVETGRDFPWDDPFDLERVPLFEGGDSFGDSFGHFLFRLNYSTLSAWLWRLHKGLEAGNATKSLAAFVPEP